METEKEQKKIVLMTSGTDKSGRRKNYTFKTLAEKTPYDVGNELDGGKLRELILPIFATDVSYHPEEALEVYDGNIKNYDNAIFDGTLPLTVTQVYIEQLLSE